MGKCDGLQQWMQEIDTFAYLAEDEWVEDMVVELRAFEPSFSSSSRGRYCSNPALSHLWHADQPLSEPSPWWTRLKIAVGEAKGLAFLHEAEKPIIYRDFKTSNILLDHVPGSDSDYTTKLSDFGPATDGPEGDDTHISTSVMGTHGYVKPEYVLTGHLTAMSDVYSFAVVLLELLTRQCFDRTRRCRERDLCVGLSDT